MITFVCWKWHVEGTARAFESKHVNVVFQMLTRWYARPFKLICITDEPDGLDPRIEAVPMPDAARQFLYLRPSITRFPSCYCRLWIFSREAAALGERIFQLDIDCIITGNLTPLVDREEDFVGWSDRHFEPGKIAGAAFLLRTGSMPQVWEDFDPITSPAIAHAAGYRGSDQAWMSYRIGKSKANSVGTWRNAGLVKINWTPRDSYNAPQGARIVFTNGEKPPWNKDMRQRYPWIRRYWKNP